MKKSLLTQFILTDIEGSTRLWERHGDIMGAALAQHDAIMRQEIGRWGGRIVKHTGDGIFAVFEFGQPLQFALQAQRQLRRCDWGAIGELRVRFAIHAGRAQERDGDYFGAAVSRTARLLAAGRGGQILLTAAVAGSARLPTGASLQNLGAHRLKDLSEALQIFELAHPELARRSFPLQRRLRLHSRHPAFVSRFLSAVKAGEMGQVFSIRDLFPLRAPHTAVSINKSV